jgi:YVTN family beta-propeller protein
MPNVFLFILSLVIVLTGCTDEAAVDDSANAVGSVERIYGVGYNRTAAVGWAFSSAEIVRFGVYRHATGVFSPDQATRIATIPVSSKPGIIDTGLVNGTQYFYTVVPELMKDDGSYIAGRGTKMIIITPNNNGTLTTDQIVYSQHIQPLFTSGCAVHGCHGGDALAKRSKALHGGSEFDLSSWTTALNGTDEIAQIVPYRSLKSHIIQHLNSDTTVAPAAQPSMPPGFAFPAELRDLLIRWIDNGAKNDNGAVAYTTTPVRGWAYVTNQGEDLTAVIDLDKNRIARYVTTGVTNTAVAPPQAPHNAVVDRNNEFYYINLIGGSKLLKIRVADNTKAGELTTGLSSPAQVALTRNGDTAYVSNFENAKTNITVVNTVTMTKIADIGSPAMLKPHGVSITPDYQMVVVANSLSDNITLVRTSDHSIVATIPVSGSVPALPVSYTYQFEPYQSVITPDSKFAYVTCRKSGEVRVIDLAQKKVIDSIKVGTFPLIPAIAPAGDYVYVANRNSNSVSAIKTATRTLEYTVANVGVEPHGIAVSKDGKFVYVSCENLGISEPPHHATAGGKKPSFLKVIDIATRTVTASLELGNFGSGMALTN